MATTVDWPNRIIHVPRADMLLVQSVPTEIRELDLDAFRRDLKSLEDDPEGMPFPDTHNHNTIVTLGGVTYARLIEIINNYTVTFEDGQYAVNLVGANSNVGDVVNVNQVSVRSANSAGLTYSKEIEDQSFFDGRIAIDTQFGSPGTQFPKGTLANPVDTLDDAQAIITIRGLAGRYNLSGTLALDSNDNIDHSDWRGSTPNHDALSFDNTSVAEGIFKGIALSGSTANSDHITLENGLIENFSNFVGDLYNSAIGGTIVVPAGVSSELYTIANCFSSVPGTSTPIFDLNDATNLNIQFRRYTGGIEIQNYSSVDNTMTIDLNSGHVKLDSTVTAGTIVIRGTGHVTDNSPGTATIITDGLTYTKQDKLLTEKRWIALH